MTEATAVERMRYGKKLDYLGVVHWRLSKLRVGNSTLVVGIVDAAPAATNVEMFRRRRCVVAAIAAFRDVGSFLVLNPRPVLPVRCLSIAESLNG